jgi:hypothetical protein
MMMKRHTKRIHFFHHGVEVLVVNVKASRVDDELARMFWLNPNYSATVED